MFFSLIKKIFFNRNARILNKILPLVKKISQLEEKIQQLSDHQLSQQTVHFRHLLAQGANLDSILPEAFATVREASHRILGKRHFDVQLIGGIALHRGMIAQMKTGEGKTLVAPLSAYLNALSGKGVHVVTVNDYLAYRDATTTGQIFEFLGMKVGCIGGGMSDAERYEAYGADITYGTNNEFGFDYLRDNLKYRRRDEKGFMFDAMVQRPLHFAIIDEVDSILIDEARTPLIISGKGDNDVMMYSIMSEIVKKLSPDDYEIDLKSRIAILSEQGNDKIEEIFKKRGIIPENSSMYDVSNMSVIHYLNQSLKAHYLFEHDKEYVINEGKIMIIDEFTGRIMDGRRYSDGLHQAIEAKEKVKVNEENQTISSTTFQNYFRLYHKLAGMTGTASTEAIEFKDIYNLDILEVPTNLPVNREDCDDIVYSTENGKYQAIVKMIEENKETGRPVLVGTTSIENSEKLSNFLHKKNIAHRILNAKYHEQEAHIIAQAGRIRAVTVATNMAGRGTDIMLGGNAEFIIKDLIGKGIEVDEEAIKNEIAREKQQVIELGGLLVIGTERHDARRIDDQLRGRSGRQGDPGKTVFFLSLEDRLMKVFGSEKLRDFLTKLGLKEDEAITHSMMTKAIVRAQQKVESSNYEMRKNILHYDDVVNTQRQAFFRKRFNIIDADIGIIDELREIHNRISGIILDNYHQALAEKKGFHDEEEYFNEQKDSLLLEIKKIYPRFAEFYLKISAKNEKNFFITKKEYKENSTPDNFFIGESVIDSELVKNALNACFEEKVSAVEDKNMLLHLVKRLMLEVADKLWRIHLGDLDQVRKGIYLRSYGQQNPLNEYKSEAFILFKNMIANFEYEVLQAFMHMRYTTAENDIETFSGNKNNTADSYVDKKLTEKKVKKLNVNAEELKNKKINNKNNKKFAKNVLNSGVSNISADITAKKNNASTGDAGKNYKKNADDINHKKHKKISKDISSPRNSSANDNFGDHQNHLSPSPAYRKKVEYELNYQEEIGRNDPCHCGSGMRYKNCHGKI